MSQQKFIQRLRQRFSIIPGCLLLTGLTAGLLLASGNRLWQEALAERISPAILRFHVLADSNRNEDQEIKLEVRSLILDYLREQLAPDMDKAAVISCIQAHAGEIRERTDQYLQACRVPYRCALQIANDYFPARSYGRLSLPCGSYDTLRITLGSGEGHNWWCVLYPQFCFPDATFQEALHEALKEEDYQTLIDPRARVEVHFFLLEFMREKL